MLLPFAVLVFICSAQYAAGAGAQLGLLLRSLPAPRSDFYFKPNVTYFNPASKCGDSCVAEHLVLLLVLVCVLCVYSAAGGCCVAVGGAVHFRRVRNVTTRMPRVLKSVFGFHASC